MKRRKKKNEWMKKGRQKDKELGRDEKGREGRKGRRERKGDCTK